MLKLVAASKCFAQLPDLLRDEILDFLLAGDAALLSAPEDVEALAVNLLRLLTDRSLRDRQVAAGRARAALYTWSASAAAHRDVYESVAAH